MYVLYCTAAVITMLNDHNSGYKKCIKTTHNNTGQALLKMYPLNHHGEL